MILLETELEACMFLSGKEIVYTGMCTKTLCQDKFKGSKIIDLIEEISRQTKLQAVAWVLLIAFSHIYSEK